MTLIRIALALLFIMMASIGASAGEEPVRARLALIYTGMLSGELEPCGCTAEGDFGGIRRLATELDRLRAQNAGRSVLVSTGGLFGTVSPTHEISNRFILEATAMLGYDAIGVQWSDLVYGESFLRAPALPWTATNWIAADAMPFASEQRFERGGLRIAYLHWLRSDASPYRFGAGADARVHDQPGRLRERLRALRAEHDLIILGVDGHPDNLSRLPLGLVDVLIMPAGTEQTAEPGRIGGAIVLMPGNRGQQLGRVQLQPDTQGRWQIADSEVIALAESVPDAPRMADWYARYERALREDYDARAAQPSVPGDYLGSRACETCHAQAYRHWQGTVHSRAHDALVSVGKQYDPYCVSCHVIGFGQRGGFTSLEHEPDLRHVGCESCHGPGRAHVRSFAVHKTRPVDEATCLACHTRRNSPAFDFRSYLPRILHGQGAAHSGPAR
ncbi:MAG: multiheme c-type cytochrome [Burkholderiaceae bacterium]